MSEIEIHGYAIVSADDRFADATGHTPATLMNEADWRYFQEELDRAAVTVLGRIGHEVNANAKGRMRMVVSSAGGGLERRPDGWWWNPARATWREAAAVVLPRGGRVAVPGGAGVFDLFLDIGYDAFHLSRARGVLVPDGRPLFSESPKAGGAEALLAARGLQPGTEQMLDAAAGVTLTVWRRPAGAGRRG